MFGNKTIQPHTILCSNDVHKDIADRAHQRGQQDRDKQWKDSLIKVREQANAKQLNSDAINLYMASLDFLIMRGPQK